MEVAEISKTTPIDLRHVNQCRLYLKVQRLSDPCNGAGTEFLSKALSHTYHSHNAESNSTWPRQCEPSPRAWATWKKILRRLFLAFHVLTSPALLMFSIRWYGNLLPISLTRSAMLVLAVGDGWNDQLASQLEDAALQNNFNSSLDSGR
jgi:hypothetical protein